MTLIDLNNLKGEFERISKMNAEELAIYMHDNYEFFSKKEGCETQEKCKVEFDKLPEENKQVMFKVANAILTTHILPLILYIKEIEK